MKQSALLLAIIMLSSMTLAQTPETPEVVANTNAIDSETEFIAMPVDSTPIEGALATESGEGLISITVDNTSIADVVRLFNRSTPANIISTPSNLTSMVSVNLENVEWQDGLSQILRQHNLSLNEQPAGSGIYSIRPKAVDAPEPLVVKTIFLEYTTVDGVTPVIEKMITPPGKLSTFASRNAIVIQATENNLAEIEQVVKVIDIQSKQVCIEALFMELNDSAIKQIGIRWDSLAEFGVEFQAGPFSSSETTDRTKSREDALARTDSRTSVDAFDELHDQYGDQYEVSSIEILELPDGSFIQTSKTDPTRRVTDTIELSSDATSDITDTFAKTINESSAAILSVDSLKLVLSALKSTDGVSVVSNPKMIVVNGATNAFFRVGEREPIIKTERTAGTQDSPADKFTASLDTTISTEYIKSGYLHTGIELKVIPTVKSGGLIEAQIEPSLRRKLLGKDKVVGDNSWPSISVKEIKTQFTLQSGQTVAIGGLTDTTDSKQTSKIPLLGDIPLIGKYLFSHTKDVKSQVETIIFVTLTMADPAGLSPEQGIPERAELVHKRLIQQEVRKEAFDAEIVQIKRAAKAKRDREKKLPAAPDSIE